MEDRPSQGGIGRRRVAGLGMQHGEEALEMANTVEWRSKRSERLAAALRDAFRFNLEVLGEVRIEKLLPKIIDAANALLNAERGVLFLRRSGRMVPVSARSRGRDLSDPAAHLSRTILDRAVAASPAIPGPATSGSWPAPSPAWP